MSLHISGPALPHIPASLASQLLAAQIVAWGGNRSAVSSGDTPTFTLSAANTSFYPSGTSVDATDARLLWLGGDRDLGGVSFPSSLTQTIYTATLASLERVGMAGRLAFDVTDEFEIVCLGRGAFSSRMRMRVNGAVVPGFLPDVPGDGNGYYVRIQFPDTTRRRVEIVLNSNLTQIVGLRAASGSAILAPADMDAGLRCVIVGDSITEGTGATSYSTGYAPLAAELLGLRDCVVSGLGGTGYFATTGTGGTLASRLTADVIDPAPSVVILAMGLNDETAVGGGADLTAAASSVLASLLEGLPDCLVYVLGPWNPSAPTLNGNRLAVRDQLQSVVSASGSYRVRFLDPTGVSFTKFDGTHPDDAGHVALSEWLDAAIRSDVGIT